MAESSAVAGGTDPTQIRVLSGEAKIVRNGSTFRTSFGSRAEMGQAFSDVLTTSSNGDLIECFALDATHNQPIDFSTSVRLSCTASKLEAIAAMDRLLLCRGDGSRFHGQMSIDGGGDSIALNDVHETMFVEGDEVEVDGWEISNGRTSTDPTDNGACIFVNGDRVRLKNMRCRDSQLYELQATRNDQPV